ncbi:MAG TPA: class I SAM-dependent methyltransferase [Draconibacterium sp.]|nr:class I SAM-dependent methyltransferase [Draconibacterium sp.]
MEQLQHFFQDKTVNTLLDVGTGTGNFIAVLKETFVNLQITGIDPDETSLNEAALKYPDVEFKKMSGGKLDFPDSSFDGASISMALHHLPDVQQTLMEMRRVVKPGGWIIVNELFSDNLNPAQEVQKLMHHFRSKIDRLTGVCHNETFTRSEILDLIENSGLKICAAFNNNKAPQVVATNDLAKRFSELKDMLEQIKDKPEYHQLDNHLSEIEKLLTLHGFQMATRVVVVAIVHK